MSECMLPDAEGSTPELPTLSERVQSHTTGPWQILALDTDIKSVVSFQGSFCTYPDFEAGDLVLQDVVVALLDKGTRRRHRFQIAEELENRGAQLGFSSDGLRIRFSGRALPEDVRNVVHIVAEQLREPLMDPEEFEKARAYVAASLRREMESTSAQAAAALSRLLYPSGHPNYMLPPETALERLSTYTVDDARSFHEKHFSAACGVIAVVGDLDDLPLEDIVRGSLSDWEARQQAIAVSAVGPEYQPGNAAFTLADKSNTDIRLGHPLRLLRDDPDYIPLYVGNYILGGNFSARLMNIIRDRLGLTYGIWSHLSGITTDYSGHWAVGITLSKENIERGTAATKAEMIRFVNEGIDQAELADKQTTIAGAFQVGLATTGGLASSLLHNAERGFDVGYLDRFPDTVKALMVEEVNDAIRENLSIERLSVAAAGETPA